MNNDERKWLLSNYDPTPEAHASERIDFTDLLYFPAAFALSWVLMRWLPSPLAITLAGTTLLLVFSIFASGFGKIKRLFLPLFVAALVTFALAVLL